MIQGLAIGIGLLAGLSVCQVRPPNYSPDLLPDTSFTCEDKVSGSYYADVEASCQLFHVCVQVSEYEFQDFHFLCPNDTVFDQQHLVCTNWFDVDCIQSTQFFPHDFAFDKTIKEEYQYEYPDYEDTNSATNKNNKNQETQSFLGFSQPSLSSELRNGGRGHDSSSVDQLDFDLYEEDEDVQFKSPGHHKPENNVAIGTTPISLGFVTTMRPFNASPRVKSNIHQRNRHRGGVSKSGNRVESDRRKFKFTAPTFSPNINNNDHNNQENNSIDKQKINDPFDNPPFISVDGKKPRVKANINNRFVNKGNTKKTSQGSKPRKQGSKKVELDRSQFSRIDFVKPTPEIDVTESPFIGPDVKPDGRLPRVKANILAANRDQGRQSTSSPPSFVPFVTTRQPIFQTTPQRNELGLSEATSPQNFIDDYDDEFNSLPTRRGFVIINENNDITSPRSRLNTNNNLQPHTNSILSNRPTSNEFGFSTNKPFTSPSFSLSPRTTPKESILSSFNVEPTQKSNVLPPLNNIVQTTPSFSLGPPPQPSIFTSLHRNRNRFGTRPRVKANELAQQANVGTTHNRQGRPKNKKTNFRFKTAQDIFNGIDDEKNNICNNPFKCPPSRVAGGRRPRVKSNIKARRRNFWNPRKTRVIKRRKKIKDGRVNAKLLENIKRGRQGRKQSSTEKAIQPISNSINDKDIKTVTTPNPISSLQQLIAKKEQQHKSFEIVQPARSFQNKRLRSKQKINTQRNKILLNRNKNDLRETQNEIDNQVNTPTPKTTPTPKQEFSTSTAVSLFLTNPSFIDNSKTQEDKTTKHEKFSSLPFSSPTQSVPQQPFTMSDMGLFVTNPRALPEHHKSHDPFIDPPTKTIDGRKPRVKSNIRAKEKKKVNKSISTTEAPSNNQETTEKVVPVLRIKPDGRVPRVKANIKNKLRNKKNKQFNKNNQLSFKNKLRHRFEGRQRFGKSLDVENTKPYEITDNKTEHHEPEVKPDGRKPRVKSNISAKKSFKGKHKFSKKNHGSFKHSNKVITSTIDPFQYDTTPFETPDDLLDDMETVITTFRPIISLDEIMNTNKTVLVPSRGLSIPLPNIRKQSINEKIYGRFSGAVFRPTPRGFRQHEPAFSDYPDKHNNDIDDPKEDMKQSIQSATEIVKVSSKDQSLFDSDYNYEDYYYSQMENDT